MCLAECFVSSVFTVAWSSVVLSLAYNSVNVTYINTSICVFLRSAVNISFESHNSEKQMVISAISHVISLWQVDLVEGHD